MSERWLYGWGLGSIALGGASLVVPLYLVDLGGGPFVLGLLAAVAAFVGVPGALAFGRIADKTGKRRILVLAALGLITAAIAVIPLLGSVTPVILANSVIWFAFAAATPVMTLLAVADVPESDWSEQIALLNKYQGVGWAIGLLVGALWTALGALAGGIGSILGGWLAAESYLVAFGAAGGLVLSGALIVIVVRRRTTVSRRPSPTAATSPTPAEQRETGD